MSSTSFEKTSGANNPQHVDPRYAERMRNRRTLVPATDIVETGDTIVLTVDMPGVASDGINILLEKNVLTLEGNVDFSIPKGYTLAYAEFDAFDYKRTFTLSAEIDRNNIQAKMKDGVLRLTLPKAAAAKARKITVQPG